MIFYAQEGMPENAEGDQRDRVFLDTRLHRGCALVLKIEADDWRSAREQLPAMPAAES